VARVKLKTAEEFYMWLDRKVKAAKRMEEQSRQVKTKGKK
jgi:hypothetical protein